jgi:hypothetical protein
MKSPRDPQKRARFVAAESLHSSSEVASVNEQRDSLDVALETQFLSRASRPAQISEKKLGAAAENQSCGSNLRPEMPHFRRANHLVALFAR